MKATAGLLGPPQVLALALSLVLWTLLMTLGPLQRTAEMQEQLLQQLHGLALVSHSLRSVLSVSAVAGHACYITHRSLPSSCHAHWIYIQGGSIHSRLQAHQ